MEDRLKRRKLDALKRGVHRVPGGQSVPISTNVVGIGKAGAGAVAEMLRGLEPVGTKFSALVVDVGEQDLPELRAAMASVPAERAEVTIVSLDVPERSELFAALDDYPRLLTLEYPRYFWSAGYEPWLDRGAALPAPGGHLSRAVAKAVYGFHYYAGDRPMERALRRFAAGVQAARAQSVIAIVFGLGGGVGGGIAVDLARHLSTRIFGRAILVAGIGIAPCDGDLPAHDGASIYPTLNELDCLGDEGKNSGVTKSCGDLFANPFTAGFIVVPQQHVWRATQDLAATNLRADREIATLLTARDGGNLWETLRLLNWVAAPSTQHSAARTPWGPKWIHMLGFADAAGGQVGIGPTLSRDLGLLATYHPEYVEFRVAGDDADAERLAASLEDAFAPDVPPQPVQGGREGSVQFILPCVAKTDLAMFSRAREAYEAQGWEERVLDHSMLLEQGVVLSEPSTRLEGMAGASLSASGSWVAVPFDDLTGRHAAEGSEIVGNGAIIHAA